jgi:anti-sigma B factor antagonist
MAFEILPTEEPGTLRLVGDLDLSTVEAFKPAIEASVDSGDVTLDLSGLQFIDSSGIRALLQTYLALKDSGRNLVLVSPTPFVSRVFDTLELASNGMDIREEGRSQK